MTTLLSGWGRYPTLPATVSPVRNPRVLAARIGAAGTPVIARGFGRSYGDASLGAQVLDMTPLDHLLEFDAERGELTCGAGLSLASILDWVVPRGWFLPVLPGTGAVSVGGAIASDVHGKNHHHDGSFSDHVLAFDLLSADGVVLSCTRSTHGELFAATAGGMGLTGLILNARLRLRRISSSDIDQRTLAARGLDGLLDLLGEHDDAHYSVAWLDASGGARGVRALVMLGEHAEAGALVPASRRTLTVPCVAPRALLSRAFLRAFNTLYFRRGATRPRAHRVHYANYFFPLDAVAAWPRLYGRDGFVQHQSVIPHEGAHTALGAMLEAVADSAIAVPLAVLKRLGRDNGRPLSFPRAGVTLALDLPWHAGTAALCARLDAIVADHGGRQYLAKDACMSRAIFRRGYPTWSDFASWRERSGARARFQSALSERLGL